MKDFTQLRVYKIAVKVPAVYTAAMLASPEMTHHVIVHANSVYVDEDQNLIFSTHITKNTWKIVAIFNKNNWMFFEEITKDENDKPV